MQLVHRLQYLLIAVYNHLRSTVALDAISVNHADQTLIGIGIIGT